MTLLSDEMEGLFRYKDILENTIERELGIIVPEYPSTSSVSVRITFLERFLIKNGKAHLEKQLWEDFGKELCKQYLERIGQKLH
jgi:hypothetical protein